MATALPLVSLSDYLKFEAPGGAKDELIEGEIVISPSAKPNHAILSKHLVRLLDDLLENSGFEVNADLSIVLDTNDPASMPRPDVFVMERTRFLAAANRDAFPEGSPELAIEIVSPSNTKRELSTKVRLYLLHGSSAVWVIYPKTRTVTVWEREDASTEYGVDEFLTLPQPLPRLTIPVSRIFSSLS